MLLRSIRRLLTAKGYEVEEASDGKAAVARSEKGDFDVILSDIAMPGMDGIDLLRAVRRRNLDVPVVLITGEPAVSTAVKALKLGAFHYLTKPVELAELEEVIDKAACLHRMARMKREAARLLGNPHPTDDDSELEANFQHALGAIWIAYQPIISARTGHLFGYEALLRSRSPTLPYPGAMLDAAERLDRIHQLGRTIRALATEPMPQRPAANLFVNLHTNDLLDEELFDPNSLLSGIADRVILEVTERASLGQVGDAKKRVAELREMGFRIAIDDLGAGYAGLTSFAQLEPEVVKLDMSLIRDIHISKTKQKLVRSMTALCQDMGMLIVAEGIECTEERDTLMEIGCDLFQGFLFAKPDRPFPDVSWSLPCPEDDA
ncbi:MAG: EAL domain-containing protein [Polyangiaceae bacterium]|nr:EAL domain-containing protein [Polyangiaceae bacterium]